MKWIKLVDDCNRYKTTEAIWRFPKKYLKSISNTTFNKSIKNLAQRKNEKFIKNQILFEKWVPRPTSVISLILRDDKMQVQSKKGNRL